MKKVIILVDGQNLFYTLKELGLREIQIDWKLFFNNLIETDDELLRVYWFRPENISRHEIDIYGAKYYFPKCKTYSSPEELLVAAQKWYDECLESFKEQDRKYDRLKLDYENIAIVKKGLVKVDPWKQTYLGEKGVDVSLVVNMIKLMDKIDKIILISGDYDYSEAVEYVKEHLKKVHIVRFKKDGSDKYSSMSKKLILCADKVIDISQSDLKTKFKRE